MNALNIILNYMMPKGLGSLFLHNSNSALLIFEKQKYVYSVTELVVLNYTREAYRGIPKLEDGDVYIDEHGDMVYAMKREGNILHIKECKIKSVRVYSLVS